MNLHKFKYADPRGERADTLPDVNRSELARQVGVSRSQLSRILGGRTEPPVRVLRALAVAWDASLDDVDRMLKALRKKKKAS